MSNKKDIIIDLNKPKVSVIDKNNFVYIKELNKVINLIKDRLTDINNIEKNNYNKRRAFEESRMHDTILIDGKRGSGKTTFLLNVKNELNNNSDINVKVLDSIDPNQLDEKSNILLILLAHIYTELLISIQSNKDINSKKKNEYKKLTTMLHNLTSAISATQERNYEDDYHKLYNLHQSLIIDERLHDFFSQVCSFFSIDALILPIDDIDMDFTHGYKVIDSIRKYLSTSKIIPIISIDTTQIYALIKKAHYKYFDYSAHASKKDIKTEHELGFLKSLPEEYVQKILMPTRKIVLPDMYELYKFHLKDITRDIYLTFTKKMDNNKNITFKIKMDNLLKSYINIVLGNYEKNIKDIDNFHILNYLKNKSFRAIYEDMISFLNGLYPKDKKYFYNTQSIKTRLIPLYMSHFDTKYDSTIWFWDKYMFYLQEAINSFQNIGNYDNIFYTNISKYILSLDSFHDDNIQRHEQLYARLYMQDFFIENITIEPKFTKNSKIINDFKKIKKIVNISGIIELLSRTMIPIHIFELLINERIVDIFKYNLTELTFFGRDNNETLRDTMFNLSTSILKYYRDEYFDELNSTDNSKKIIGIFLNKKYENIFSEYSIFIERYIDFKNDKEIFFLSPLKFYSILPYYFKAIYENKPLKIKTSVENFTKEFNHSNIDNIYGVAYPLLTKKDIIFGTENSNFGIITIDAFTKSLVKNILQVSIFRYSDKFIDEMSKIGIASYRLFLNKNINAYKTIYFNHLILFLIKKVDNNIADSMNLDLGYITKGTREVDLYKYKLKETYFADNIKKILKNINNNEKIKTKYSSIEPFLYKLYLSLVKNWTYQSSYYLIKDEEFSIEDYIDRYINEVKEGNNEKLKNDLRQNKNQFKELKILKENLNNLYAEGEFLIKNKGKDTHSKILMKYKEEYKKTNNDPKKTMYNMAKLIANGEI